MYIDNVTSAALAFGVGTKRMKFLLNSPEMDFSYLDAQGGAMANSWAAHGERYQAEQAEARRENGRIHGKPNLIQFVLK